LPAIKIITDSCSDLPEDIRQKYDIRMLPTPVQIEEQKYFDRDTISTAEFYQKLRAGYMPKTSQITPAAFEEAYREELEKGYKVLTICFSGGLSGIYQSAVLAAQNIASKDIKVIDSRCCTIGLSLVLEEVAQAIAEDKDLSEAIDLLLNRCSYMEHIFSVGSIEMLKKGGRISGGKALLANILNIKPILHFEDGEIVAFAKARGEKRMLATLIEEMRKRGADLSSQKIGLAHSASPELAQKMQHKIEEEFGVEEFLIGELGAAIGSHVGIGTIAVFFQGSEQVNKPKVAEL